MSVIAITDYFDFPKEEKEVLGDLVGNELNDETRVLLVWHKKIDQGFIDKYPNLIGVQRYGAGYDNVDVAYLTQKGIPFANNPDYGVDEVADTALAMILNIARGITRYDEDAKFFVENWQENIDNKIKRNSDTTIGVIGAGRIGSSVLLKAKALKFDTVFFDPFKERGHEKVLNARRVDSLVSLLSQCDIVSLHLPLNQSTEGLVDESFLANCKPGISIVNTARGGLFKNLGILKEALFSNKVFCLATDVLPVEPPPTEGLVLDWRNNESWLKGRLIINPHAAYYSNRSIRELRINAASNALRMLKGEQVFNLIRE